MITAYCPKCHALGQFITEPRRNRAQCDYCFEWFYIEQLTPVADKAPVHDKVPVARDVTMNGNAELIKAVKDMPEAERTVEIIKKRFGVGWTQARRAIDEAAK